MRRHPKPLRNRLKLLLLLVNRSPAPPPPSLMHKRPMRRVHQPDNPMVNIARQLRHQVRTPVPSPKLRQLRHRRQLPRNPTHPRLRDIDPRIPIPLHTRIRRSKNLGRIQRIMARQRRNLPALSRARLKPPPVVLALHRLPIEPPGRQRNPPMRTKVPQSKHRPILLPPHQHRKPQQHRRRCLPRLQPPTPQPRIPIPKHHPRRGSASPPPPPPPPPRQCNQLTHLQSVYPCPTLEHTLS